MSNVIQVLAKMGSDANCQSEEAINELLVSEELNSETTQAIVNKDVSSIERQLNFRSNLVCIILAPDDVEQTNSIFINSVVNF